MKSNLFSKLCVNPQTKYSPDQLKKSIEKNICDIIYEKDPFEINLDTSSISNLEKYYAKKIAKYEPRASAKVECKEIERGGSKFLQIQVQGEFKYESNNNSNDIENYNGKLSFLVFCEFLENPFVKK